MKTGNKPESSIRKPVGRSCAGPTTNDWRLYILKHASTRFRVECALASDWGGFFRLVPPQTKMRDFFLLFQNIPKNKLKAFNIGTMNIKKGMSRKEQEEVRKKVRISGRSSI